MPESTVTMMVVSTNTIHAGVELTGLAKSYRPVEAARGIDLEVAPGETVALL